MKVQIEGGFINIMNYSVRPHFNSVFTDRLLGCFFVLNFVNSGKVTSLPKVMNYMKRSKYSFYNFSSKHTPSATLTNEIFKTTDPLPSSILSERIHCHQQ